MKRTLVTAAVLAGLLLATPAGAQCPGDDGTVPGSGPSVTVIGSGDAEPYRTMYVDDRDFFDLDDDGDAGGIWIYAESNGAEGLQRGDKHFAVEWAEPHTPPWPYVPPHSVIPPDPNRPVLPNGLTIFPTPMQSSEPLDVLGMRDDCVEYGGENQPEEPDTLIF